MLRFCAWITGIPGTCGWLWDRDCDPPTPTIEPRERRSDRWAPIDPAVGTCFDGRPKKLPQDHAWIRRHTAVLNRYERRTGLPNFHEGAPPIACRGALDPALHCRPYGAGAFAWLTHPALGAHRDPLSERPDTPAPPAAPQQYNCRTWAGIREAVAELTVRRVYRWSTRDGRRLHSPILETCSVCLEEIPLDSEARLRRCRHILCDECRLRLPRPRCPLCRRPIHSVDTKRFSPCVARRMSASLRATARTITSFLEPRHVLPLAMLCRAARAEAKLDMRPGDTVLVKTRGPGRSHSGRLGRVKEFHRWQEIRDAELMVEVDGERDAIAYFRCQLARFDHDSFREHRDARHALAANAQAFHKCYGKKEHRSGCFKKGTDTCRMMRGPHWTLYNRMDRWRLAGHDPPPEDAPPPKASDLKLESLFTCKMALAAASEDLDLGDWDSPDRARRELAHLSMLGRLVNMSASKEADAARDTLKAERNVAGDERPTAQRQPGFASDDSEEEDDFLDDDALAALDLRNLLAESQDADEAESVYVRHVLGGDAGADGPAAGELAPWSDAAEIPRSNIAYDEDVKSKIEAALKQANTEAVQRTQGIKARDDADTDGACVDDGDADEAVVPSPEDVRDAAMDTSGAVDLAAWDVGRGLTLRETCETGAKDHAAGTEYGAPLNERQAVAARLMLRNFEARRRDPSGLAPPPVRLLLLGGPGTGFASCVRDYSSPTRVEALHRQVRGDQRGPAPLPFLGL